MTDPPRLAALDGARGVAAVVVVIHHALLTFPRLADVYFDQRLRGDASSTAWLLSYTPLHIVWAGNEAVYLFFVLSGIVLLVPVLAAGRGFSWLAYLPRRLVRIYVPVVAAVALGVLLIWLVPRSGDPALGAWVAGHGSYGAPAFVLQDMVLLLGVTGAISPLWSLQWEVLFSLLLALFVLWAVVGRRWWWAKLAILVAVMAVSRIVHVELLFYLPMFAIGGLLIVEWARIGRVLARLDRVPLGWIAWCLVGALLATTKWWLQGLGVSAGTADLLLWISVLGVTMLVLAGAFWRPLSTILTSRPVAWLGRISFSLYLVHEPIIVSARLLTSSLSPAVGIAISVPVAFLVATGFSYAIEQPAHRLSKRVGRRALNAFRHDLPDAPPAGASAV